MSEITANLPRELLLTPRNQTESCLQSPPLLHRRKRSFVDMDDYMLPSRPKSSRSCPALPIDCPSPEISEPRLRPRLCTLESLDGCSLDGVDMETSSGWTTPTGIDQPTRKRLLSDDKTDTLIMNLFDDEADENTRPFAPRLQPRCFVASHGCNYSGDLTLSRTNQQPPTLPDSVLMPL